MNMPVLIRWVCGGLLLSLAAACNPPAVADAGDGFDSTDTNDDVVRDVAADASDVSAPDATVDVQQPDAIDDASEDAVLADAPADAVLADAPADASPTGCGTAPYLDVAGVVTDPIAMMPIAGATVSSPFCPGLHATTDSAGHYTLPVQSGATLYALFEATGYVTVVSPEAQVVAATTISNASPVTPAAAALVVPGFSATRATITVSSVQIATGATGACASADGITFSVMGHPEATVEYYFGPRPATPPTATDSSGLAAISNLMPTSATEFVTVVGTKPGCTVTFAHTGDDGNILTGRTPIIAGDITFQSPQIHN
jgi:hypothetical protein